jgi:hypothetical protein
MKTIEKRRSYTPEEVVNIYKKHGSVISLSQAKLVLDFLKGLSRLTIEQIMNRGN